MCGTYPGPPSSTSRAGLNFPAERAPELPRGRASILKVQLLLEAVARDRERPLPPLRLSAVPGNGQTSMDRRVRAVSLDPMQPDAVDQSGLPRRSSRVARLRQCRASARRCPARVPPRVESGGSLLRPPHVPRGSELLLAGHWLDSPMIGLYFQPGAVAVEWPFALPMPRIGVATFYLPWKLLVGLLNRERRIARTGDPTSIMTIGIP